MKSIARGGFVLGALILAVTALGTTASRAQTSPTLLAALPAPATLAAPVGAARPIAAWVAFCERYAAECAIDANEPARITLTPTAWTTITTVNRRINAAIRPVTDLDHWGTPDRWDLAEDGSGDCEDFQLLKRKLLAEAGLPRRAMRMTVVIDEKGEGHAVLTLITDRGDFVLDNKTGAVLPWHRTGYVFIKREGTDAVAWVSLGGVTSPTTTANR
ncbi:transglutaminase-like cysteine peptidase [Methylobacterium sp. J-090]|uniref:transglutaminase-like cysteine peptidase n=1 Tax=Methylobacterium sp. J-090 TaxID=2836666 RepID=UPI001FB8E52E|nr:transglutaminase-like cysteine peptidase [Methylobacterium sp. J-090]MCJ2083431.1 transglutaminase-like cysteine peptidase [Methylobacterium sp. J-090]